MMRRAFFIVILELAVIVPITECKPRPKDELYATEKVFTLDSFKNVDWVDVLINAIGIAGDAGLVSTLLGNVGGPAEWLLTEGVEIIGISRDIAKGEPDVIAKDALSVVIKVALKQKNAKGLIPIVGFAFNISNIINDFKDARTNVRIPYTAPSIGPPR